MEIITKQEAKEKGLKKYYTGKPCIKGHLSERNVCDDKCRQCDYEYRHSSKSKERDKKVRHERYLRKREIEIAQTKLYKEKNAEWRKSYEKQYEKENADRIAKRKAEYYKEKRDLILERCTTYQKRNRGRYNHYSKIRNLIKKNRVPAWANLEKIECIYIECKRLKESTGINYVVDHILPLQGKIVSGLHTEHNLRIVEYKENASKLNKWNPDDSYIKSYYEQLNDEID